MGNTIKPSTEPPYSGGQESANDLNANLKYPTLDKRIVDSYAKRSTATLKNSLYNSYLRAFRWAADRVGDRGVVAYVSNGNWIEGNSADGVRLSLADEYSRIYVYNLRGNQRTAGELSHKEGGKVFGSGSRNTVAIMIGVKNPAYAGPCEIFYRDIGDSLTRERKLEIVASGDLTSVEWQVITPDQHGDWVNQRSGEFEKWPAIGDKNGGRRVFGTYSAGLKTSRDSWCYNFSGPTLKSNIERTIAYYDSEVDRIAELRLAGDSSGDVEDLIRPDSTRFSWDRVNKRQVLQGKRIAFDEAGIRVGTYRPFQKLHVYFDRKQQLNNTTYQLPAIFPTPRHENIGILVTAPGGNAPFACRMTDLIPDLVSVTGAGNAAQYFPRWTYVVANADGALDIDTGEIDEYGYRRVDNITDEILTLYQAVIGNQVTKADIFFYVYGLLHDPNYRKTYAADLKKMLPHIPTPEAQERFEQLVAAGRALSDLHVNYEYVEPYPVDVQVKPGADHDDPDTWRLTSKKMKWAKKKDSATGRNIDDVTKLIYSPKVTIARIPEVADRYMIGSRSALAWIIDRYLVKTDSASGIVNDPNDWCDEHDDPRYVVDLIAKVTTVAVETMKIVDSLAE